MTLASLIWGSAPAWILWALLFAGAFFCVLLWSYTRGRGPAKLRAVCGVLKAAGIATLIICLVEPLFHGTRPRPGANLFVVLVDSSRSLEIRERGDSGSRGDKLRSVLDEESPWLTRLAQDFDIRKYAFDTRLRATADFSALRFDGGRTQLKGALEALTERYRDRPVAGVLLFTDGIATDIGSVDELDGLDSLPAIYPVPIGQDRTHRDIGLRRITVSQSNFELSPVTIEAELSTQGFRGESIQVALLDANGEILQTETVETDDERSIVQRFQVRPRKPGLVFYEVRVGSGTHDVPAPGTGDPGREATLSNNHRRIAVDRESGPYRVLYVSGRPNWELKFLRRALAEDDEVELVGLIRVATREPKFEFRSRVGESTNPLFRGFGNEDDEEAERYDEPVIVRLGVSDRDELREGFPKTREQLYRYHALILDDLEAAFFTQDQMSLIQDFVSERGGGFLMLGGPESFVKGKYDRTAIGEVLPVYLDGAPRASLGARYRLALTREGWLEPWVRLRKTEDEERERLRSMPEFMTLNRVRGLKPGATVLQTVRDTQGGETHPALVTQRFGRGRSAALLVADLWRWNLARKSAASSDLETAWRQILRWLVADVPRRLEVRLAESDPEPGEPLELSVRVNDEAYRPLDNARVTIEITSPDGAKIVLDAEPSSEEAGLYTATHVPRTPGNFLAHVKARAPDGSLAGERETGWTAEDSLDEFRSLQPDRDLLEGLAAKSGGEVVSAAALEEFVASLPNRKIPITEPWIYPLWDTWAMFVFAVMCLLGEWGLRRWKGLP